MIVRDRTPSFKPEQLEPLLDVVAEVLVLNPSASLAEVSVAAGSAAPPRTSITPRATS